MGSIRPRIDGPEGFPLGTGVDVDEYRLLCEVGDAHGRFAGEGMLAGQRDLHRFGVEREELEPFGVEREPDERDVYSRRS
jgi:hypothetical protein